MRPMASMNRSMESATFPGEATSALENLAVVDGLAIARPSTTARFSRADVASPGKVADSIDRFIDAIGRITAWSSFALAAVMGTNVLLRYGFSTGSVWAQELEWHLMAPICLFGMSYALRHGEHVRVDVLYASFSQRSKDMVEIITSLIAMTV